MEHSSSSSSKEEIQEIPAVYHPCFFNQALSAILECLGVQIKAPENCSASQESSSSTTAQQNADLPSTTTLDTEADPSSKSNPTVDLAVPPRPGVRSGRGPESH